MILVDISRDLTLVRKILMALAKALSNGG